MNVPHKEEALLKMSRKMFDRSLEEIALEAVAEPSQCLRIRADMYSTTTTPLSPPFAAWCSA
jgi:hypothetical protein